jgi:hypothetical protein
VVEGVYSNMTYLTYCKNLCKYYNVPPPGTKKKLKNYFYLNFYNGRLCFWLEYGHLHQIFGVVSIRLWKTVIGSGPHSPVCCEDTTVSCKSVQSQKTPLNGTFACPFMFLASLLLHPYFITFLFLQEFYFLTLPQVFILWRCFALKLSIVLCCLAQSIPFLFSFYYLFFNKTSLLK